MIQMMALQVYYYGDISDKMVRNFQKIYISQFKTQLYYHAKHSRSFIIIGYHFLDMDVGYV